MMKRYLALFTRLKPGEHELTQHRFFQHDVTMIQQAIAEEKCARSANFVVANVEFKKAILEMVFILPLLKMVCYKLFGGPALLLDLFSRATNHWQRFIGCVY